MYDVPSIDTDGAIGTILSHFNPEYILHVVTDSLHMKFRPFEDEMPNIVDVLERDYQISYSSAPDFVEQILTSRTDTYEEIIKIICNYYNLEFTYDFEDMTPEEMYGIARTLYDVFVARFTENMIGFFVRYILDNTDDIYQYLTNDDTIKKPKENSNTLHSARNYLDPKFIIIHANINQVIYNMAAYDIPLQILLNYFFDPNTAAKLGSMILDKGDIYKNHYAKYIIDPKTTAGVLTNVKLALQSQTLTNQINFSEEVK